MVGSAVGRALLSTFAGAEITYASDPQFELQRSQVLGGWAIVHSSTAANPTWLNCLPLDAAWRRVRSGDCISIGPEHLMLDVSIEFSTLAELGHDG
jgi:hypothetical protein